MTLLSKPNMIEVLHGQENIIKTTLIGFQDIEKQLDGCFDHTVLQQSLQIRKERYGMHYWD
jgi:hypothetical protein